MTFDSVVVGGGVSGLTAALILARHGRKVALVEKERRLAPLIRGFIREGIYFDSAFHYAGGLADGEVLDLFFRYLGLAGRVEKYPFNPEGFDVFRDTEQGRDFPFPAGLPLLQTALQEAFPAERYAVRDYLRKLEEVRRRLPYLDPDIPADQWDAAGVVQGPSLAEVLEQCTGNLALKNLLSLHTLLHGVPAREVSFAIHASVAGLYYHSAYGLVGGGRALAEAFEDQLNVEGITPITGRGVKRLNLDSSGGLQGVELDDGERIYGRECLVTTHPSLFLEMAPPGTLRPAFKKRIENLEESATAFVLYGTGPESPQILTRRNLIVGKSGGDGDPWYGDKAERPFFLSGGAACRENAATSGWVAICPVQWDDIGWKGQGCSRQREAGYADRKSRIGERLFERIRQQVPELANGVRLLEMASPLTLQNYTGSPTGGLYGVKHKVGQYNPQPAVRIPGVYLAGQAVAAPGILGAIISAFLACGHLFGHDHLRREVLACR
ncbi:MAG: FAD-dependent oxidoreductase [Syntrophotaleaceae bacterium]